MLPKALKLLRTNRKMSQRELADIIGVSQQTIGSWEVGRTSPDPDMINKLAQYFNVPTDYLLGNNTPAQAQAAAPKKPRKLLELIQDEEYTLNGQVATPEDREKIARVIEALYYDAKEKNKRK